MLTDGLEGSGFRLPSGPPDFTFQVRMTRGSSKQGNVHMAAWWLPPEDAAPYGVPLDEIGVLIHESYAHWPAYQNVEALTIGFHATQLVEGAYCLQFGATRLPVLVVLDRAVRVRGDSPIVGWLRPRGAGIRRGIEGFQHHHGLQNLRPTWRALELLARIRPATGGPHTMSDEKAFDEAVRLGLEWLADHPGRPPHAFGVAELAQKRVAEVSSTRVWLKRKHFGIHRVQRELDRRISHPGS